MKKRLKIPWSEQWRRQTRLPASGNNLIYTPKDFIISFTLYIVTVIACMLLRSLDKTGDTSYVAMLFLTDVFLTAVLTDGYLFSILCAVLGVFSVDYIFTYPYWHISFTLTGFPLTFLVMMTISVLTAAVTSRAKQTEAVRREAEREKMYADLLRAVSHDIRTPLTGIVGATNVLLEQENTLTPEQRHELIRNANEEAQWLIRIVENLLSITRMGGDEAKVNKTPEAAEEIIEGAVGKFTRRWGTDIPVEVHLPEEFLLVPMDPLLMEQVLTNLMENAVLHGVDGAEHGEIWVRAREQDGKLQIQVLDNGRGLPTELLGPYARRDRELSRGHLGLYNVDTILIKYYGEGFGLYRENRTDGPGAVVTATLPIRREEKAQC